jgi:hypothetical protein
LFPLLAFCEVAYNALKLFGIPISAGLTAAAVPDDSAFSVRLIMVRRALAYLMRRTARLRLGGKLIGTIREIRGRAW